MYYITQYQSPLGKLLLASDGENIIGLWLEGQKYFGEAVKSEKTQKDDLPVFAAAREWLDRYFSGEKPGINELPLAPRGSSFSQKVWKSLCEIPYGQITCYGEIAKKIAIMEHKTSMSSQAIGGAISIIIPCHRVVGANGNLTGYAGGIAKKVKLLDLEGVDMTDLTIPTKGTAL
ncbi:MAG: methylated-DNA--[protein]-cysteine S-methyltransferase [Bacillota bacterium]